MIGWAVCKYCEKAFFKTHSAPNKNGVRKNYGLSAGQRHIEACKKSVSDQDTADKRQVTLPQLVYNKRILSKEDKERLKNAETLLIVDSGQSFKSLENDGLLYSAQVLIDIGAKYGKLT